MNRLPPTRQKQPERQKQAEKINMENKEMKKLTIRFEFSLGVEGIQVNINGIDMPYRCINNASIVVQIMEYLENGE